MVQPGRLLVRPHVVCPPSLGEVWPVCERPTSPRAAARVSILPSHVPSAHAQGTTMTAHARLWSPLCARRGAATAAPHRTGARG